MMYGGSISEFLGGYGEKAFYRVCIELDMRTLYLVSDDKKLLVIQTAE